MVPARVNKKTPKRRIPLSVIPINQVNEIVNNKKSVLKLIPNGGSIAQEDIPKSSLFDLAKRLPSQSSELKVNPIRDSNQDPIISLTNSLTRKAISQHRSLTNWFTATDHRYIQQQPQPQPPNSTDYIINEITKFNSVTMFATVSRTNAPPNTRKERIILHRVRETQEVEKRVFSNLSSLVNKPIYFLEKGDDWTIDGDTVKAYTRWFICVV